MNPTIPFNPPEPPLGDLEGLRSAHASDPNDTQIAAKLAQLYADKGWLNEAMELYKTIIDSDRDNYPLLLEYGNVCFRKKVLDEALQLRQAGRASAGRKPDKVLCQNYLRVPCR
jgi:tetratricopeptide (TPR) repeat protein